jgi:hypothetical protein
LIAEVTTEIERKPCLCHCEKGAITWVVSSTFCSVGAARISGHWEVECPECKAAGHTGTRGEPYYYVSPEEIARLRYRPRGYEWMDGQPDS